MAIFLIGPPGAGKSTLANLLSVHLGFDLSSMTRIVSGKLTRPDQHYQALQFLFSSTKQWPSEFVFDLLSTDLARRDPHKLIVDGFPKNLDEINLLSNAPTFVGRYFKVLIVLDCSPQVLRNRLRQRKDISRRDLPATYEIRIDYWRQNKAEMVLALTPLFTHCYEYSTEERSSEELLASLISSLRNIPGCETV